VPTEVGVRVPEVAPEVAPVPGVKVTDVGGTAVPLGQSAGPGRGPHTVKATVPSGGPPPGLPVTVTASVTVPVGPMTTELGEAVVVVDEGAGVTVKHSAPVCWATSLYGPPGVAAKDALKQYVPTDGMGRLGRVNVASSPLVVELVLEPRALPPVHGVKGALSWHNVQLTVPVGGPPTELPATVAVSFQGLPTEVSDGGRIVVVNPGVAAVTAKHSAGSAVPVTLSLEPL
jgi:hypothetical protein